MCSPRFRSGRSAVKLGTACMVSGTRDPLYLALEWATLDALSNGRTILGTGMGNPEEGVRREYEAVRLEFEKRAAIFEEGLDALRQLWTTGKVDLDGQFYKYDNISFYSGTEMKPLGPVQTPPPIWVVSNPRLTVGNKDEAKTEKVISKAARRIATYGDGWMTCCRARHPEEFAAQLAQVNDAIDEAGRDRSEFVMSYQVTMNIADTREEAHAGINSYISQYYPELSKAMDLLEWGPIGTPDDVIEWIKHLPGGWCRLLHLPLWHRWINSDRWSGLRRKFCRRSRRTDRVVTCRSGGTCGRHRRR